MAEKKDIEKNKKNEASKVEDTKANDSNVKDSKVNEIESALSESHVLLKEQQEKFNGLNDKYVRLAAEFDNYRRRTSKEKLELVKTASEDVIKGLLPILDDCQRALKMLKESETDSSSIEGTELILNKLFGYLKSKGVELIDAIGKELDTDFHEAIAQCPVENPEQKNKIIDVVQEGYTLYGKVIRYSKVVVGV